MEALFLTDRPKEKVFEVMPQIAPMYHAPTIRPSKSSC